MNFEDHKLRAILRKGGIINNYNTIPRHSQPDHFKKLNESRKEECASLRREIMVLRIELQAMKDLFNITNVLPSGAGIKKGTKEVLYKDSADRVPFTVNF